MCGIFLLGAKNVQIFWNVPIFSRRATNRNRWLTNYTVEFLARNR